MSVAIVTRPFPNDPHCGDRGSHWQIGDRTTLCIVDGVGHGKFAEIAAKTAVDYVAGHLSEPLPDLFAGCNVALRHTRGVAMGIAMLHGASGTLTYAGIGNTRGMIVRGMTPASGEGLPTAKIVRLSNFPGIVGGGYRRLVPETFPLRPGNRVILFTDGVPEHVDLSNYGVEVWADERRLAERILHDWGRETDDVGVLVYREEGFSR